MRSAVYSIVYQPKHAPVVHFTASGICAYGSHEQLLILLCYHSRRNPPTLLAPPDDALAYPAPPISAIDNVFVSFIVSTMNS